MTELITDKKVTLAIQGFEGSFHHMAGIHYFKNNIEIAPMSSFNEVVAAVEKEEAGAGIMAIENSIAGTILSNYNLLQRSSLSITGEIFLQIGQHLMALSGQKIEDLKEVHSHPMAIMQCEKFFRRYPAIHLIESEDTALSAKNIRIKELKGIGAIAGSMAAEIYGLEIIEPNIETVRNNFTRFLILSKDPVAIHQEYNKASLYFKVAHKPGALVKALNTISDAEVNLSKIQSLPIMEFEWEYYFLLDIEFNSLDQYQEVIKNLSVTTEEMKVLGVYKKGITI